MDLDSLEFLKVHAEDGVVELHIDRPRALNALNSEVLDELDRVITALGEDKTARCLILTGAGEKAFVAGADIAEMNGFGPEEAKAFSERGHRIFDALASLPMPVLAAVNGYALGGGCELALAADVLYASAKARFGQPEVKLGLVPGFGGSVRLMERIGVAAASEWIFSGGMFTAEQALEVGLVRRVLPPDELLPHVRQTAKTIAQRAPLAVQAAKRVMRVRMMQGHQAACAAEQDEFGRLFASDDMREGTTAFLEKREATFQGA